jgi:hypothetical protein
MQGLMPDIARYFIEFALVPVFSFPFLEIRLTRTFFREATEIFNHERLEVNDSSLS